MNNCPACNAPNQPGALFCEMCGTRLPSQAVTSAPAPATSASGGVQCPTCGHAAMPGEAFCDECGTPLNVGTPIAPAAATPPPASSPAQPAPQATFPAPTPLAGTSSTCPSCGANVIPGEAFCDNCGASLLGGTTAAAPTVQPVKPAPPSQPPTAPAYMPPAQPAQQVQPAAPVYTPPPAPAVVQTLADYVLVTSSGTRINLPAKHEALLGREDAPSNNYPDVDFNPHNGLADGVGRRHARLFLSNGHVMLEDLNSTNGTLLNKQRLNAKQPTALNVGDEIRLGKLLVILQK